MSYIDEIILRKREEKKSEQHTSLDDGIYIEGAVLEFERRRILEKFSVMVPAAWRRMPDKYARIKYPSEFRPQEIITSPDLGVNLGFTIFQQEVQGDTPAVVEKMQMVIHRANPDFQIYKGGSIEKVGGAWFAFRSHSLDSDLYNMMLAVKVDGLSIQGIFNCPYQEWTSWKKVTLQMWETIKTERKGL